MVAKGKSDVPLNGQRKVLICQGTGCTSSKSDQIRIALEQEVQQAGLDDITVDFTGCHGFCQQGPIVVVEPEGTFLISEKMGTTVPVETSGASPLIKSNRVLSSFSSSNSFTRRDCIESINSRISLISLSDIYLKSSV